MGTTETVRREAVKFVVATSMFVAFLLAMNKGAEWVVYFFLVEAVVIVPLTIALHNRDQGR